MKKILFSALLSFLFLGSYAQIPADYYNTANGKTGTELKAALYDIIKGHTEFPYSSGGTDVWDILKEADKDPNNSANVILIYTGNSVNAAQEYNGGSGWNREHVWAKSHGDFGENPPAGTDAHHLRASNIAANGERGNKWFAECEGCSEASNASGNYTNSTIWEPRDEMKGDVARMIFYMATRYEGENGEPDLTVVDYFPSVTTSEPIHAYLPDLLQWNIDDPVSDFERNKNEVIYSYQNNANPFIDHPEWVECIWNANCSGLNFTSTPVEAAIQDILYTYNVTAEGDDGKTLSLSVDANNPLPNWLNLNTGKASTASATLTGTPASTDLGTVTIYLIVSEVGNESNTVSQTFDIEVTDGNLLAFTTEAIKTASQDVEYVYTIEATGNDGKTLTIEEDEKNPLPTWLSFDVAKNSSTAQTLRGTPTSADLGINSVSLKLYDDVKTIYQNFDINVTDPAAANTVIITQYYEGSTGNNKFIEITNIGDGAVDLSNYYIARWRDTDNPSGAYDNGSALTGSIDAGESIVFKNAGSDDPNYPVATAIATEACYFGGNDPIALMRDGDTWEYRVDCLYAVGDWGEDKGFCRKTGITAGNLEMSVLDGTGEWIEITEDFAKNASPGTGEYIGFYGEVSQDLTGIKTLNTQFNLYPNPAQNSLVIEAISEISKIEILSITGQKVQTISVNNTKVEMNISELERGIYFLNLTDFNGNISSKKFVKQ